MLTFDAANAWVKMITLCAGSSQVRFGTLIGRLTNSCPEYLEVRETRVRVEQPGFRTKEIVVVTTLLDPEANNEGRLGKIYIAVDGVRNSTSGISKSVSKWTSCDARRPNLFARKSGLTSWLTTSFAPSWRKPPASMRLQPREISFKGTVQTLEAFQTTDELSRATKAQLSTTALPAASRSRCDPSRSKPSGSIRTTQEKEEPKKIRNDDQAALGTQTPDAKRSYEYLSAIRRNHRCDLGPYPICGGRCIRRQEVNCETDVGRRHLGQHTTGKPNAEHEPPGRRNTAQCGVAARQTTHFCRTSCISNLTVYLYNIENAKPQLQREAATVSLAQARCHS